VLCGDRALADDAVIAQVPHLAKCR
jgi:hypothetical protein